MSRGWGYLANLGRRSVVVLTLTAAATTAVAQSPAPRVGIISGDLGSFASTILGDLKVPFEKVDVAVSGGDLPRYQLLVVDNLYRLKDLNAPAFKSYVQQGGVLLVLNPKPDGFTNAWAPYDVFVGEFALEGRIVKRDHPLFREFPNDKLQDFAESNGPFVGNCSLTEPAREWQVLARHASKKKNALIVEASAGRGHVLVSCTRLDHYNAKPGATRLGRNLFRYMLQLAGTRP